MAALRKDQQLTHKTYECIRLPDGRVGNYIKGSTRPIRDDVEDKSPHGTVDMERGIVVSCNAYFAQLGTYDVGAQPLLDTANLLGIAAASPNTAAQLKKSLPQSSYGQGAGGRLAVPDGARSGDRRQRRPDAGGPMDRGRNQHPHHRRPQTVLTAGPGADAGKVHARSSHLGNRPPRRTPSVPMAGKTGTAELQDAASHAWFIGFAPYGTAAHRIAFSVLVENGVYGGTAAAPAAAEIVNAAVKLGLIEQ